MKKFTFVLYGLFLLSFLLTNKSYAFSPSDVPGLTAWYKPESLQQLNNNDPISNWPDSSSNGYTLEQATSSKQPFYYTAAGINGFPTVRFEGNQELKLNGNLCNNLSNQVTLFVVTRPLNDEAYNIVDTNPLSDTWWRYDGDGTSYPGVFRPDRVDRMSAMPNAGAHIFTLESGINYSFYKDRVLQNSVGGNFSCGDIFGIGGMSGGKTLVGDISEVIVYDSILSDTDRTNIESYLYGKYFATTPTPPPPSFLPSDVPGLTAWYKPESLQLNDNDAVSTWSDSSGNGYTLQQLISSEQPTYTTLGINGLPTITFSGGQELKLNGNLCNSLSNQASLFVVTRPLNATNYNVVDTNPATDSYWRFNVYGNSYLGVFRLNRAAQFNSMPTSGTHIFTLNSGTSYSFYVDSVEQYSLDGNFSCGDIFGIGGLSGGKPLVGDISEIIVYDSALSDTDRTNVGNYLYRKYINIAPSVNIIPSVSLNEDNTYSYTGSFTDPDSFSWTAIVNYGDGSGIQSLPLSGTNFTLNHVYQDNGSYSATVFVTDTQGSEGTKTTTVTVNNVPPSVEAITVSMNPIQINTATTVSANFTDQGVLDTHTAVWNWGDGNTSSGTITETSGSGSVSDSHIYTSSGVYLITLTVTDKDGGVETETFQYLSVYSPTPQGLFSAGQKFTSPVGAYTQNPSLTGNIFFGLSYKYQETVPVGNRQFSMDFNAADFHFYASSINTLVISNGIGTLTGTGTINESGTYNFLVTGSESANTIRIQIKDALGNKIYDTQLGSPDTAIPTTAVTAGNVLAH